MKLTILFHIFCASLYCLEAHGAYYDTLPKGVRNFTFRLVQTGNITGSYGSSGDLKGYNINANINADTIKGINSTVDTYLNSLSPADYAAFSFGTFEGSAKSKVTVQAFGAGYGITDKLTVYAFIPFYNATVDLQIQRTQKGRNNVGTAIQLENLPDVDVRLIQSLFVNYYQYQPLGTWRASGFGDTEAGFLYQIEKWKNAGALISMGFVAPTGKTHNPDILQDIAFGDGAWDAFYEFGGGYTFNPHWSIDHWYRFTYQFPYHAIVRLPDSSTFPVTKNKGEADIKLGNKAATNLQLNYAFSDEWTTSLLYALEYTEKSKYRSADPVADQVLENDTEKVSHTGRVSVGYSTLSLFREKRFFAPISLDLAFQSIFAGKNVPRYDRADFEIRFFF